MPTFPLWVRLPGAYNAAIGRMVSRFAVVESALRQMIYALLEVEPKYGRVAVRNPRVDDSFTMIEDLMSLRGFKTSLDMKELRRLCKQLEQFRDKVAHGVWARHTGSKLPVLQVTAGNYQDEAGRAVKARIVPRAVGIAVKDFKSFTDGAVEMVAILKTLAGELQVQHDELLEKRHAQLAQDRLKKSPQARRTRKGRKRQRGPFSGSELVSG